MARYTTPPPRVRSLPPPSPHVQEDEVTVEVASLGGENLGSLKVRRSARIIDVQSKLMTCLGGSLGFSYEPRLVWDEQIYEGVS